MSHSWHFTANDLREDCASENVLVDNKVNSSVTSCD